METKTSHTPTPWEAKEDGRIAAPSQDGLTVPIIAKVQGYEAEVQADAAHIVRCVNVFDAMLAALKEARDVLKTQNNGNCLVSVLDAIAAAEGNGK